MTEEEPVCVPAATSSRTCRRIGVGAGQQVHRLRCDVPHCNLRAIVRGQRNVSKSRSASCDARTMANTSAW